MPAPRFYSSVLFGSVRDTPGVTWSRETRVIRASMIDCPAGHAAAPDDCTDDPRRPYCADRMAELHRRKDELDPDVVPYVPVYAAPAGAFNSPVAAKGGPPSKLTPQQVQEMLREKDAGKTTRQLAQEYGVSKATVSRLAAENRPPGYEPPRSLSNDQVAEAIRRFEAGEKWAGIAESLGVRQDTLTTRVRRHRQAHS